jgi:hypothetical protein
MDLRAEFHLPKKPDVDEPLEKGWRSLDRGERREY